MSSKEWKLPLNLAIGFHVLLAVAVVYLPHLLTSKPRIEEVYTVNIINMADMAPAETPPAAAPAQQVKQQAKPQATPPPPKTIEQPPAKKIIEKAIALEEPKIVEPPPVEEAPPVAPPAPPEAISIKPSKRKVKSEVVEPPPPPQKVEKELKVEKTPKVEKAPKVEKDLSQVKRQKLAEMIRAEQQAAEEARILSEEAEIERRLAEAALTSVKAAVSSKPTTSAQSSSAAARTSDVSSALEKQYYAAVMARIQAFWSLPEYKKWDPSLKATVVITVERDGKIAGNFFEVQSGDKVFDRFATKALQDVGYLPPIPGAIKKDRMEFGLNFTPGGIGY